MDEIVRALLRLQDEEGWLSPKSLAALARRMKLPQHRLESVSTFYTHFRREPPPRVEFEVCRDLSCRLADGEAACARLRAWAGTQAGVAVKEVSCLGRCDQAPAAVVGHLVFDPADLAAAAELASESGRVGAPSPGSLPPVEALAERAPRCWAAADPYARSTPDTPNVEPAPDAYGPSTPATSDEPVSDYRILRSVLEGERSAPIAPLEAAGLRGMGGAGFPTARKWSLVAGEEAESKHVICNADESEPGTFKDREILYDLPHLVIEGMAIAAYCVGADRGTVFIRHEYGPERVRLEHALESARAAGALGQAIFGTDFNFEIDVFVSPGGYILGEETALLECMEGRRGEPRNKPPFPGSAGLHGQPTLINNVETLMHAVSIVAKGADWWRGLGRGDFAGHKFLSVSGDVERSGVSLVPMGMPLGEILDLHGGMRAGASIAAVAPGGASSNFLGTEALSLPLDFDALQAAGTMLGSGAVVFVAEDASRVLDLLDVGLSITRFFRNESCGKCVPCRVGSEKAVAVVEAAGRIGPEETALLGELHATMQQTSICGLGQVALGPLLSIASRFPEEVDRADSN